MLDGEAVVKVLQVEAELGLHVAAVDRDRRVGILLARVRHELGGVVRDTSHGQNQVVSNAEAQGYAVPRGVGKRRVANADLLREEVLAVDDEELLHGIRLGHVGLRPAGAFEGDDDRLRLGAAAAAGSEREKCDAEHPVLDPHDSSVHVAQMHEKGWVLLEPSEHSSIEVSVCQRTLDFRSLFCYKSLNQTNLVRFLKRSHMRISQRSYYGMLAMVFLAKNSQTMQLSEIAKAEHIPADFLEKILQQLKKAGLVASHKGVKGGYALAKPAKKITANDVIDALEGSFAPFMCVNGKHQKNACPREVSCVTKNVWQKLDTTISKTLQGMKLADLIK